MSVVLDWLETAVAAMMVVCGVLVLVWIAVMAAVVVCAVLLGLLAAVLSVLVL